MTINRRQWLTMASAASLGAVASKGNGRAAQATKPQAKALDISEYEPRSMLHVKQTRVERARYPLIDIHTHLSMSAKSENGVSLAAQRRYLASPAAVTMNRSLPRESDNRRRQSACRRSGRRCAAPTLRVSVRSPASIATEVCRELACAVADSKLRASRRAAGKSWWRLFSSATRKVKAA